MSKYLDNNSYTILQKEGDRFYFETDFGNSYNVYFSRFWLQGGFFCYDVENVEIYEFSFQRLKINSKIHDKKVGPTILKIARDFLNPFRIVFYASDNPTKRDYSLFLTYHRWYNNYFRSAEDDDRLVYKMNKSVDIFGTSLYFSIFFRKTVLTDLLTIEACFLQVLRELYWNADIQTFKI